VVTTSPGTEDYAYSGVNSLVVPAGDASSMAWAVLEILSDRKLSDRLRAEGTRTAASFTWSRTTGRFLEYIADCLPGGHRQPGSA
jgi:glycosyltransferase involved in cell wall biosynthesis